MRLNETNVKDAISNTDDTNNIVEFINEFTWFYCNFGYNIIDGGKIKKLCMCDEYVIHDDCRMCDCFKFDYSNYIYFANCKLSLTTLITKPRNYHYILTIGIKL